MAQREPSPSRPNRRFLGLPPRIAIGFGAAVVSLAAAAVFATVALSARTGLSALHEHAAGDQLALEEVESTLLVAHSALDAYLGTRDPRARARHLRALSKLEPALGALPALPALDPAERSEIDGLLPEVEAVESELAKALALADAGSFAEARALRARGVGTGALERAKDAIEVLEVQEKARIDRLKAAAEREAVVSTDVFLLAIAAMLVLVALAGRLVRDEIRARERNEDEREQALKVQRRLLAVVSHDLRNPLTGILTAGWALARAESPQGSAALARRIVAAGQRMERLIRDLLDWSRIHAGADIPLALCDADAYDVCRRITDELSLRQHGRISLEREGDTSAVFDPDRMEQVVANLVANALKYSPTDAPVRVRVVGEESSVGIEVLDEGPGIPPDTRTQLFQPFRRGLNGDSRDPSRVGLGLFIVRTLTEAQGGRIEVDSAPGRGTRFVVRLPRPPGPRDRGAARA